jgi:isocitrate dehydrogenase kinase/phosphatase
MPTPDSTVLSPGQVAHSNANAFPIVLLCYNGYSQEGGPGQDALLAEFRTVLNELIAMVTSTDTSTGLYFVDLIRRTRTDAEKAQLTANWILQEFELYYYESRAIPGLAQRAFEDRDPKTSLALSKKRLSVYNESINALGPRLKAVFPRVAAEESIWSDVQDCYIPLIEGRYEADLAFAYLHSVKRKLNQGEWKPVAYDFGKRATKVPDFTTQVYRSFPVDGHVTPQTVERLFAIPGFSAPYRDTKEDAVLIAERLNQILAGEQSTTNRIRTIEMIDGGFYRNRGAYLGGRMVFDSGRLVPLAIALLNGPDGIYADAVIHREADMHNLFSSTLAHFHVTNPYYHELSTFLHTLMPERPLGLHYTTIGFNHVGKVAVMEELRAEIGHHREALQNAVGFRGTVAIGFSAPSSAYNLKVIRDQPTEQYKWGEFHGVDWVLSKYSRVHEIDRTGSMLDNVIYFNMKLDRSWFDPALLDELLEKASESVSLQRDDVVFKHLIVQRRMVPLPVFLEAASTADAETAVVNLGHCIKNNAAANIFNRDLDGRNYGVSRFLKVFLYDYDALEHLTDVKVRTNLGRIDGEEDIPEWYFEDGVVFLPEEMEVGLMLPDRTLRRVFRACHGDLMTTAYWERIQNDLRAGEVPSIRTYPEACKLQRT